MILPGGRTCGRNAQNECVGIPDFTKSLFPVLSGNGEGFTCPGVSGTGTDSDIDTDNFIGLPVLVKGLMMSLDYVKSVHADNPPEKSCMQGFDPFFVDNGAHVYFLNRLNSLDGSASGAGNTPVSEVTAWYDDDYSTAYNMTQALGCFVSGGNELTLYPGILEPMLSVGPDAVDISGIPAIDAQLDGIMLNLLELANWRTIVEAKLNELAEARKMPVSLFGLFSNWGVTTSCSNCGIRKISGSAIVKKTSNRKPRYEVSGCNVVVNGKSLSVSHDPLRFDGGPSVSVWLNVTFNEASPQEGLENVAIYEPTSCSLSLEAEHGADASVQIGGVHTIEGSGYVMYIIDQVNCNLVFDFIKTDEGFVYTNGSGGFGGVEYGDCDNEQES